jgi:hypothetical protein
VHACVSHGNGSCLPAKGSSRATTCPVAPALVLWLKAAPEPPCVLCPSSRLLAQGSSEAATCFMALALATRPRGSSRTATCSLGSSSHLLA